MKHVIRLDLATDHTPWLADGFGVEGGVRFSEQIKTIIRKIIARELTPLQREIVNEYYYEGKGVTEIANLRGINKSTVSRTLKAARERIEKSMKYCTFHLWQDD